jgi:hypothetical protein
VGADPESAVPMLRQERAKFHPETDFQLIYDRQGPGQHDVSLSHLLLILMKVDQWSSPKGNNNNQGRTYLVSVYLETGS